MANKKDVKKRKIAKIISWFFGVIFIMIGFGGLISSDYISGLSMIILGCILLPIITDIMKNKFNFKIPLGVKIALFVVVFMIIGITAENGDINSQLKQNVNPTITQSNNNENVGTNVENIVAEEQKNELIQNIQQKEICPKSYFKQGMFQSDWSYCVDLCLYDKDNDQMKKCEIYCERLDDIDYRTGSNLLSKRIQKYKCVLCGECTEEQLKEIEDKRIKDEEVARIHKIREECREKCRNEAVSQLSERECYPNGRDGYTPDECSRIIVNCIKLEECNALNGSEEQLKVIEEKKKQIEDEQRKEEQEKLEL